MSNILLNVGSFYSCFAGFYSPSWWFIPTVTCTCFLILNADFNPCLFPSFQWLLCGSWLCLTCWLWHSFLSSSKSTHVPGLLSTQPLLLVSLKRKSNPFQCPFMLQTPCIYLTLPFEMLPCCPSNIASSILTWAASSCLNHNPKPPCLTWMF